MRSFFTCSGAIYQCKPSCVTAFLLYVIAFTELFYTERAHVRMMKVLENLFYQPLIRDSILPSADIKSIFSNLEEIVQLHSKSHDIKFHRPVKSFKTLEKACLLNCLACFLNSVSLTEQMAAVRKKNETALIDLLGDDLLSWVRKEEIQRQVVWNTVAWKCEKWKLSCGPDYL